MNKSMLMGVLFGVGGAVAGGAVASFATMNKAEEAREQAAVAQAQLASVQALVPPQAQFATVVSVDPVTETIRTPSEQCHTRQVVHRRPVQDEHRIAGTVLGGVIGGALGNQIGKGSGRDVATVAGAVAGGYAGNRVQKNLQENDTYTTSERRCSTVTKTRHKTVGYDESYRWNGAVHTMRMQKRPGDRLPVKDGAVLPVSAKELALYD